MFEKIKDAFGGANKDSSSGGLGAYSSYVKGIDFPISKGQLLDKLQEKGVDEAVLEHVRSLSKDHFDRAEDVFKTLGG